MFELANDLLKVLQSMFDMDLGMVALLVALLIIVMALLND
jgi:hypothetical protein